MRQTIFSRFFGDCSAAISPLYAVAILPLVVMSGVAFDYSRLMAMDSELQNAADQAALAAATQLTGQTGAIDAAEDAARNYFINETRAAFGDPPIDQFSLAFYEAKFDDNGDFDPSDGALDPDDPDSDTLAEVVEVTIGARQARFALTPVMGALFSDNVQSRATAMLDESTCNVSPMMFCAPSAGYGANSTYVGKTVALHLRDKNTPEFELPTDAPGNFGFLNLDYDTTQMPNDRMGLNTQSGVCVGGRVVSDTGNIQVEAQYFNTRFERLEKKADCGANGDFCASQNVRQGYVQVQRVNSINQGCAASPTNEKWEILKEGTFPLEGCIAAGTCTFADGPTSAQWDNYMAKVHPGVTFVSTGAATRFDMHQWEIDAANGLNVVRVKQREISQGKNKKVYDNYCAYPAPQDSDNVFEPGPKDKDRRVLTVAAADCSELKGKGVVKVLRWLDIFLLDSAHTKGSYKEFVAEIIGPGTPPGKTTSFQQFARGKAVLVQ